MNVTAELIEGLTKKDGQYFLPRGIQIAIENRLDSNDGKLITSEYARLSKQYEQYRTLPVPAVIDYKGPLTLDAYTAFYFSRNFCIPLIGLRDLVYNPAFQQLPSEINVLDIGSGTGAIVLGLLWMFNEQPLSTIALEITAIDSCAEALNRQEGIVRDAGFNMAHVKHCEQSICDTDSCIEIIKKEAPFNLVFIANCLTETPEQDARNLIARLPEIITDDGAIIIAEAQRDYTKTMLRALAKDAPRLGLNVYYPCPLPSCPYVGYSSYCWVWRYHSYLPPDIKVNGIALPEIPKNELVANWLILTKQNISIYDEARRGYPDLSWGPVSKEKNGIRAICNEDGILHFEDNSFFPYYRRGHIVGLTDKHEVGQHYQI